jgi:hypothetical protein
MIDPRHDASITRIRSQIRALDDDEPVRRHLDRWADEVEASLGRSDDAKASHQLREHLTASILKLKANHPHIAELLDELMEQLGKMGV